MSEQLERLRQAKVIFGDVLENVTPDQMGLPTVNDDWDVRALINHVVMGNQWSAENVRTGNAPRPSGDAIGDRHPREAYAESANLMMAAFAEPGALGRIGADAVRRDVRQRTGGHALHRSALPRLGSGAGHRAEHRSRPGAVRGRARPSHAQRLDGRDRAQTPFKDEVPVPADAPAADRLAGYLGKPV